MIYFVDEDCVAYRAWIDELEIRGFTVKPLRSADEAFDRLWNVPVRDAQLVIIDVMLAVDDVTNDRFSAKVTDNFLESGLRLLEQLANQNEAVFPQRAVLLTNTINESTLAAARSVSSNYKVELWDKREMLSPLMFGDRVTAAISKIENGRL